MFNASKSIPSPCLHCGDRYVGCHSNCKKYEQYKEEIEEIKRQGGKFNVRQSW